MANDEKDHTCLLLRINLIWDAIEKSAFIVKSADVKLDFISNCAVMRCSINVL